MIVCAVCLCKVSKKVEFSPRGAHRERMGNVGIREIVLDLPTPVKTCQHATAGGATDSYPGNLHRCTAKSQLDQAAATQPPCRRATLTRSEQRNRQPNSEVQQPASTAGTCTSAICHTRCALCGVVFNVHGEWRVLVIGSSHAAQEAQQCVIWWRQERLHARCAQMCMLLQQICCLMQPTGHAQLLQHCSAMQLPCI